MMAAICRANQRPAREWKARHWPPTGSWVGLRREVGEGESATPPPPLPLPAKKQLVIQQFLLSDSITFPVSLLLRPPLITSFHQGSSLSRLKRKKPAMPDGPFFLFCSEEKKKTDWMQENSTHDGDGGGKGKAAGSEDERGASGVLRRTKETFLSVWGPGS